MKKEASSIPLMGRKKASAVPPILTATFLLFCSAFEPVSFFRMSTLGMQAVESLQNCQTFFLYYLLRKLTAPCILQWFCLSASSILRLHAADRCNSLLCGLNAPPASGSTKENQDFGAISAQSAIRYIKGKVRENFLIFLFFRLLMDVFHSFFHTTLSPYGSSL